MGAAPNGSAVTPIDALAAMASDPSGTKTFERYRWQVKQSVWRWLSCLGGGDAPIAIACEQVEDVVVVYATRLLFAQLKTRDRGSWSTSKVCQKGGGLDALIRAYNEAVEHGIHESASFELWLEGAAGETKGTATFFSNPASADAASRKLLIGHGLKRPAVDDFLARLSIRTQQPARGHIDAVVLQTIGALWPAMSNPERIALYDKLLLRAESAQSSEIDGNELKGQLALQMSEHAAGVVGRESKASKSSASHRRILTREELTKLTPPLAGASREDILRRIERGDAASALELKLRAAGASEKNLELAQTLRASADRTRLELLAAGDDAAGRLAALEERLLQFAGAHVERAGLAGGGNAAIAAHPADYVLAELRGRPADLAHLDADRLFAGASDEIVGYLCQLSDACKFWWRSA